MGKCQSGNLTEPEKNWNARFQVVAAVRAQVSTKLVADGFAQTVEYLKSNQRSDWMERMKIKSDESEERAALPKNYMKWFEGTMSAVL